MWLRYFLPVFLFAYVIAAFVWRAYVVRKRTGINPIVFKGSDNAHDFIGRISKLLLALVITSVIIYSFIPTAYQYLAPIFWLERPWLQWIGVVLLIASLVWTVLAQMQMGESWRIGIDSERKTKLIETGVFRISRNPIYVGINATQLGLFLAIPNALTLVILIVGLVLMNIQVRLEEEYLSTMHGDEYAGYTRRVRRWI